MDTSAGRWSVISKFAEWLRKHVDGRSGARELDRASEGETARIAHDLGLSTAELVNIAARGRDSTDLLRRRLEAEHLDPGRISRAQPEVMRDMSRLCSLCRSDGRCARDLARDPDDPAWRRYCPNAETLDALRPAGPPG
jgi:hypothetical protein